MARVRVSANRVKNADKKAKERNKWRKKGNVFANMSGRIGIKDLEGKSYMKLGFYKKIELPS